MDYTRYSPPLPFPPPWIRDRPKNVVRPLLPIVFTTNCSVDVTHDRMCVKDSIELEFTCPNNSPPSQQLRGEDNFTDPYLDYRQSSPITSTQTNGDLQARRSARRQICQSARVRYDQVANQLASFSPTASPLQVVVDQYFEADRYQLRNQREPHQVNAASWTSAPKCSVDQVFETERQHIQRHHYPIAVASRSPDTAYTTTAFNNSGPVSLDKPRMNAEQKIWSKRDEQDYVQKKTFTNWMNTYLGKLHPPVKVDDLFKDIRDGIVLIRLLEVLSKETLPLDIAPSMKPAHRLSNAKTALDFLAKRQLKLVNINPSDIVDGRPKIVLGLIWVIILYFQIEEQEEQLLELLGIPKSGSRNKVTAKKALTTWVQNVFSEKYNLNINDFGPSWRDGVAFNAIVHSINPQLVDMRDLEKRSNRENLMRAFSLAEENLGIPQILDPEDVDVEKPDEKSIMTYVAQFYKAFPETGKQKAITIEEKEKYDYEDFLSFLTHASGRIDDALRSNEPFKNSYPEYQKTCDQRVKFQDFVNLLRHKCELEICVGGMDPRHGLDRFTEFEAGMKQWLGQLYACLPGELRPCGRWMREAELWFQLVDTHWFSDVDNEKQQIPYIVPATSQVIDDMIERRNSILKADCNEVKLAASQLKKVLGKNSDLPEQLVATMVQSMSTIVDKADGYSVSVEAISDFRTFLDAFSVEGGEEEGECLNEKLQEWSNIASGQTQNESPLIVQTSLDELKIWQDKFAAPANPDHRLKSCLVQLQKLEQDGKLMPQGMTSQVVRTWCNRTAEEVQTVQLLPTLKIYLEERLEAWQQYEGRLNQAVNQMSETYMQLKNTDAIEGETLNGIGLLLDGAEVAAKQIGRPAQINSVSIAKRQLDELQDMEKKRKENEKESQQRLELEKAKQKDFVEALDKVKMWNSQVKSLLSFSSSKDFKLEMEAIQGKIKFLQAAFDEAGTIQTLLEGIEDPQSSNVNNSQAKELYAESIEFTDNQFNLEAHLKHMKAIARTYTKMDASLINIEGYLKTASDLKIGDIEDESVSHETFVIIATEIEHEFKELENLFQTLNSQIQSSSIKDFDLSSLFLKQNQLFTKWEAIQLHHQKQSDEVQEEFEATFLRAEMMIQELSCYFDAIESEIRATNVNAIKKGLNTFKELQQTINEDLPETIDTLHNCESTLIQHLNHHPKKMENVDEIKRKVKKLMEKHDELLKRQTEIQNHGTRRAERLAEIQACKSRLDPVVSEVSERVQKAQLGPDVAMKLVAKRSLQQTSIWLKECHEIINVIENCQNEFSNLKHLIDELNSLEIDVHEDYELTYKEYQNISNLAVKLLNGANSFSQIYTAFRGDAEALEADLLLVEKNFLSLETQQHGTLDSNQMKKHLNDIEDFLKKEPKVMEKLENLCQSVIKMQSTDISREANILTISLDETEAFRVRKDAVFDNLRSEFDKIYAANQDQNDFSSNLTSSEEWLASLESRLDQQHAWELLENSTFEAHIEACQADALCFAQISTDLNTSSQTYIGDVLARPISSSSAGLRKNKLKARFDNLEKQITERLKQCSNQTALWKEASLGATTIVSLIGGLREKLEGVKESFVVRADCGSLRELVRMQQTAIKQNLRLLEEVGVAKGELEKRFLHFKRTLPSTKMINHKIKDVELLTEQIHDIFESQNALSQRIHEEKNLWTNVSEACSSIIDQIEACKTEINKRQPEHLTYRGDQKIGKLAENIEDVLLKEETYQEWLKAKQSSMQTSGTEFYRIIQLREPHVEFDRLLKTEDEFLGEMTECIQDIAAAQIRLTTLLHQLTSSFMVIRNSFEESGQETDKLIKTSRTSYNVEHLLENVNKQLAEFEHLFNTTITDITPIIHEITVSYQYKVDPLMYPSLNFTLKSRKTPICISSLPENIRSAYTNNVKRLQQLKTELEVTVEEKGRTINALNECMFELSEVHENIQYLVQESSEITNEKNIGELESKTRQYEAKFLEISNKVKTILKQKHLDKEWDNITKEISNLQAEAKNNLDNLKSMLQATILNWNKFTTIISNIHEIISSNIAALRQFVYLKLPITSKNEINNRLKSLRLFIEDVNLSKDLLSNSRPQPSCSPSKTTITALSIFPIVSKISNAIQQASYISPSLTVNMIEQLTEELSAYSDWLEKAEYITEEIIVASETWFENANKLLSQFMVVSEELTYESNLTPDFDLSSKLQTSRSVGLQKSQERELTWLPEQMKNFQNLEQVANASITEASFGLVNIETVMQRLDDVRKLVNTLTSECKNSRRCWETFVHQETELKQLTKLVDTMTQRFSNELDDFEKRQRLHFSSIHEMRELLTRVKSLKEESKTGDDLISNIHQLSAGSNDFVLTQICSRWDHVSQDRINSLMDTLDNFLQDKGEKEKELNSLKSWLSQFNQSLQEACASQDFPATLDKLRHLRHVLEVWDSGVFKPQMLKTDWPDKMEAIVEEKRSIEEKLEEAIIGISSKIENQIEIEENINEVSKEIFRLREELATSDIGSISDEYSVSENSLSKLNEIIEQLSEQRESLKQNFDQPLEKLKDKIHLLHKDVKSRQHLKIIFEKCQDQMNSFLQVLKQTDKNLLSKIEFWREIIRLYKQLTQWIENQCLVSRRRDDRRLPLETSPKRRVAEDKFESRSNIKRIINLFEFRQQELTSTQDRLTSIDEGEEMILIFNKKCQTLQTSLKLITDIEDELRKKYGVIFKEVKNKYAANEAALQRIIELQSVVQKLDNLTLEAEQYLETDLKSTLETACNLVNTIKLLTEQELQALVYGRNIFQEQFQRGERVLQHLRNQIREQDSRKRASLVEQEMLASSITSLQTWLTNWSNDVDEIRRTCDLELSIFLTKSQPNTEEVDYSNFHSIINLSGLLGKISSKQDELESLERRVRALNIPNAGEDLIQLKVKLETAESGGQRLHMDMTDQFAKVHLQRENLNSIKDWLRKTKKKLALLTQDENAQTSLELSAFADDVEQIAFEHRQTLSDSLTILQTTTKMLTTSALIKASIREVDKVDGGINQLLLQLNSTKTRLTGRAKLRADLVTSLTHQETWLAEATGRLHRVLNEARGGEGGERLRTSISTSSRLAVSDGRLAAELDYLGSLSLPGNIDVFIQELKSIEHSIQCQSAQMQRISEQNAQLRLDYSDDSEAIRVEQVLQRKDLLLQTCQDIGTKLNSILKELPTLKSANQDFVHWVNSQAAIIDSCSSNLTGHAVVEENLKNLKEMEHEMRTGSKRREAVSEAIYQTTAAVEHALRALNIAHTITNRKEFFQAEHHHQPNAGVEPFHPRQHHGLYEEVTDAIRQWMTMTQDLPRKIEQQERLLLQWKKMEKLQSGLDDWVIKATEQLTENMATLFGVSQANASHEDRRFDSSGNTLDLEVWRIKVGEMKMMNTEIQGKEMQIELIEDIAVQMQILGENESIAASVKRFNDLKLSVKDHLKIVNEVNNLIDGFHATAGSLERWLHVNNNLTKNDDRNNLTAEGACLIERSNRLVRQLTHVALHGVKDQIRDCWHCSPVSTSTAATCKTLMMQHEGAICSTLARIAHSAVNRLASFESDYNKSVVDAEKMRALAEVRKNRLEDLKYTLGRVDSFLDEELTSWWKSFRARDGEVRPMATSLEDATQKLQTVSRMLGRLDGHRANMISVARLLRDDGASSNSSRHEKSSSDDWWNDNLEIISNLSDKATAACLRIVIDKLCRNGSMLNDCRRVLQNAQEDWRAYISDRDAFRAWLLERSQMCRQLKQLDTTSGDAEAADFEFSTKFPRTCQEYLDQVQREGERLQRLCTTFEGLTMQQLSDPVLRQVEKDYQALRDKLKDRLLRTHSSIRIQQDPSVCDEDSRQRRERLHKHLSTADKPPSTHKLVRLNEHRIDRSADLQRTRALEDLLHTVRHIKSDIKRADVVAERRWSGNHEGSLHQERSRASISSWSTSKCGSCDRVLRASTGTIHCHICGRTDPSRSHYRCTEISNSQTNLVADVTPPPAPHFHSASSLSKHSIIDPSQYSHLRKYSDRLHNFANQKPC